MEQTHQELVESPSGSGVVSSVTIKAMSQDITIFGTYWPFMRAGAQTSEAGGSLWNQLLDQYLQPNGIQENPREYVGVKFPSRWCADWARNATHVHL